MNDQEFSFKDIVEYAQDIIVVTKASPIDDTGPEIVYVNEAFVKISGYSREEVIGKTPRILQGEGTDKQTRKKVRSALEQQQSVRVTIKNYSKTGQEYWLDLSILPLKNAQGDVTHFVAIQRDFTQHKRSQQHLEVLSNQDSLTNLYNPRGFYRLSKQEFSRFKREGRIYSVLMIDLDYFKRINDNYGHAIGDLALQHFAALCQNNIRLHDVLGRVGGEEFCIILPLEKKQAAFVFAEKLRSLLEHAPLVVGAENINLTVSIGVGEVNVNDEDHKGVIQRADTALFLAKSDGRNCIA